MVAPAVSSASSEPDGPSEDARPQRSWLPVLTRSAVAVCAGVLLYLANAPRPLWWFAPIAFAGLGLVLTGRRVRAAFGYTFLFGLGYLVPLLAWTGEFVGAVAWLPLSAAEAALMALAGAGIALCADLPAVPLVAALLWVCNEWLRSIFPFGGFPWGKVAFSQPEGAYLPLASLGGTPLIAFAVALTGFGLAEVARRVVADPQWRLRRLAGPALAVLLPIAAGLVTWPFIGTEAQAGTVTVAAIQGNVPRAGLDFNAQRRAVLDNHVKRTEELAADVKAGRVPKPDLVIWPENSSDIDPLRNADARAEIDDAAAAIGAPIAVGGVMTGDDGLPRNTMILWDPVRGPIAYYTKRQLQPFGETMPYRAFFRIFTKEVDRAGNFQAGTDPTVFAMGAARVALATCYEVAFDNPVRDSVVNNSNLLAVPTNNATFGYTDMTYQQLAMDRVRAVEHGRAVVVAATSGVSAIVRPDGSVSQQTSLFTPAALVERVPLRTATTMSDRLGASPEWVMVGAGFVALAMAFVLRVRHRQHSDIPTPCGGPPPPVGDRRGRANEEENG